MQRMNGRSAARETCKYKREEGGLAVIAVTGRQRVIAVAKPGKWTGLE